MESRSLPRIQIRKLRFRDGLQNSIEFSIRFHVRDQTIDHVQKLGLSLSHPDGVSLDTVERRDFFRIIAFGQLYAIELIRI